DLTRTEALVLTVIAYMQPVTRGAIARLTGREVSRDLIARLHRQGLITRGPRSPEPGAPHTYVTTPGFLALFGLDTLRDLPDIEALEDAGLLQPGSDGVILPVAGEGGA
ncbi:SMC-Scp complex subunit ScpB, partial [Pseudogemmobacter blasticus]